MSDQTKEALELAIQHHLSDEYPGAILTGWVGMAAYSDIEHMGDSAYQILVPTQSFHVSIGLVEVLNRTVDDLWDEA